MAATSLSIVTPAVLAAAQLHPAFQTWIAAVATGDADAITACYTVDASLLPTFSPREREGHAEIRDYFAHLGAKNPEGLTVEVFSQKSLFQTPDVVAIKGEYAFRNPRTGASRAWYSFLFVQVDGQWRIAHHHSSDLSSRLQMAQQAA